MKYLIISILLLVTLVSQIMIRKKPKPPDSGFSGGLNTPFPQTVEDNLQLFARLRESLPITTEEFSLSFDYQINKFIVQMKNNSSNDSFFNWIDLNKYTLISKDKFIFR